MSAVQLESKGIVLALTVDDLAASLRFYTEALGFEVSSREEGTDTPRFAMLKAGQGSLGLTQDDFAKGRDRAKGIGTRLWIETDQDLHALAEQAKAAGVTLDADVRALPWGPLAFAVTDPDGFKLTISHPQAGG